MNGSFELRESVTKVEPGEPRQTEPGHSVLSLVCRPSMWEGGEDQGRREEEGRRKDRDKQAREEIPLTQYERWG